MAGSEEAGIERILLVGFMGSGKTTVGRLVAEWLGWRFLDFDELIEERVGCTIAEVFRSEGEAAFRRLEKEVGRELLALTEVVLASGGGWPVSEGRMDALDPGTVSVWLQVTPETAVRRARGKGPRRPLLLDPDPVTRARRLLEEREEHYRKAQLVLDSEHAPAADLAGRIVEYLDSVRSSRKGQGA